MSGTLVKLLKPKPGETLKSKHLTGEAFSKPEITPVKKSKPKPSLDFSLDAMDEVPKGPGPRGRDPNEPKLSNPTVQVATRHYPVDPQIAGTALAYHLRQIAQSGKPDVAALAEYALAGRTPPGVNGDVYKALGRRLSRANHPLAKAYNWDRMSEGLSLDNWLEKFVRKNVQSLGHPDDQYFEKVRRQFGTGRNGRNRAYDAFWSRLESAAAKDNFVLSKRHKEDFKTAVEDALHRISDRHLDRAYLAARGDVSLLGATPKGALKFSRPLNVERTRQSEAAQMATEAALTATPITHRAANDARQSALLAATEATLGGDPGIHHKRAALAHRMLHALTGHPLHAQAAAVHEAAL
jgi:hypothetical protein